MIALKNKIYYETNTFDSEIDLDIKKHFLDYEDVYDDYSFINIFVNLCERMV